MAINSYDITPLSKHEYFANAIRQTISKSSDVGLYKIPSLAASTVRRLCIPTLASRNKEHSKNNDVFRYGYENKLNSKKRYILNDTKVLTKDSLQTNCRNKNSIILQHKISQEKLNCILHKAIHLRTTDEIEFLFKKFKTLKAFTKLSDFLLKEICTVVYMDEYAKDRIIFRQGDSGTCWFVILQGSVDVLINNHIAIAYKEDPKIVVSGTDLATLEAIQLRKESHCLIRLGNINGS